MKSAKHIVVIGIVLVVGAEFASAQRTTRESVNSSHVPANGDSYVGANSRDGSVIAFDSMADNLVPKDSNLVSDVFVRDRRNGAITRVSVTSSGEQRHYEAVDPAISADGMLIAFWSASRFVDGDTNRASDVFVHDRSTAITWRVSVDSSGNEGNGNSSHPHMSDDGRIVAFNSDADDLVANDTNGSTDIFVHDRGSGITTRVSVDGNGKQSNGYSYAPRVSGDGRFVVFHSFASNLVPNDTNVHSDVFVYDLLNSTIERVSVDSSGIQGNGTSWASAISGDGSLVAFSSYASNLVPNDTNGTQDVFVHDRTSGATLRVSVDSNGSEGNASSQPGRISSDGRFVAFSSDATNLVSGDTNGVTDVFRHELATGITIRVSVSTTGREANSLCITPVLNADGRFTAFSSASTTLVPPEPHVNPVYEVFLREQ